MKYLINLSLFLMFLSLAYKGKAEKSPQSYINWSQLPQIPDEVGFAGSFAGVSNGTLLVAGGANFPDGGAPWTGSAKVWHDKIFALEKSNGQWKEVGKLPNPLGYGVSITWRDGLICIGGSDATKHYADVFIVRYKQGKIETEELPSLPETNASAAGVLIGDVIYIAGGFESPGSKNSEKVFWALDLSKAKGKREWKVLESWPGPSRLLAVAGTQEDAFYLFSGVHLFTPEGDTVAQREFLKDAYKYTPGKGWIRLADLPRSTAAAPTPAFATGQSHLLIFGGDTGKYFDQNLTLKENHPGFSDEILGYNSITNTWTPFGKVFTDKVGDPVKNPAASTWAPVTTPSVVWKENYIIPGGEIRPAVRTSKVLMAMPVQPSGVFTFLDWAVVGFYFLLTIGISLVVSKNMNGTTNDFFLGEGKIPWWAAGLSIFGTSLSALTFIAIPAKAYATDWVYFLNNMMIVAVAPVVVYFYLPYFRKLKLTSVYEYLEIRFNRKVKLLGSFTFLLFQISRLGVVIYLPSLVVSALMGIDLVLCIVFTSLVTTVYCFLGGIEAVVWTDVMQVVVLLGGALVSLGFIVFSLDGGTSQLFSEAFSSNKFQLAIFSWDRTQPVLWVILVGGFLSQLVSFSSDQVIVQRYLTTSTEEEAKKSIYTNALLTIPASLIFFGVGTALWVYFKNNPADLNPHGLTDDVFPWFIAHQLPAGLSGLVIAGVFAATMSTISSSMNSMATVVTTDFYQLISPGRSDRQRFVFARWATVALGIVGCLVSIYIGSLQNSSIWDQYIMLIGLLGGCLAGMFVAGIFFPRINSTGILIGFAVSAIALYFVQASTDLNFFLYPAIAIFICVLVGYLSSLIMPSDILKPLEKTK
ncbi:MAG TPA: sodium/solute symporter [Cytophagales bacterium]|nr:sodium/solute symporter [Cytophagales bacterium]